MTNCNLSLPDLPNFLRPWQEKDIPALVRYADNKKIWLGLRDLFPHPYTEKDAIDWIALTRDKAGLEFAIASEKEAIGGIGLMPKCGMRRHTMEIGYWLAEPFWGQGIATAAVHVLSDYAFEQYEISRLYATVFEWNLASCKVLEKAGYTCEGRLRKAVIKDGKILDQFVYARIGG